jgi:hypothetical protein
MISKEKFIEFAKNVLDDDVIPIHKFRERLHELLNSNYCSSHLFTENKGGYIKLGATVWSNGYYPIRRIDELKYYTGWNSIYSELKNK